MQHDDYLTQEEFVDGIPQNSWCEDTRDKEVVLLVDVSSTGSTESKGHRVHVRHCFSSKPDCGDRKKLRRRNQSTHLHRSDIGNFSSSVDMVPSFHHLHCDETADER